jgi:hypothetical protein
MQRRARDMALDQGRLVMGKSGVLVSQQLQFNIAGIGIDLTWQGGRMTKEPMWIFYEGFLSNGPRSALPTQDVHLQVHCGELPDVKRESLIFDGATNHWRLFHTNRRYVFEIFHTRPPHPQVQLAVMTPDFLSGEVFLRAEKTARRPSWSLGRLMRPFGELLVINLLAKGRGVLLHALGVSDRGKGLLFIGRSGAGKTTLANLYKPHQGVTVLGDERLVVTKRQGQFWLSGTPWPGGAFAVSADTVPLKKIYFLEHGPRNEVIADRYFNLYGLFFQQLFLPFWNREALAFALRFGEDLLSTVPAARLAFVNDTRVIEFLREEASPKETGDYGPPTTD